LSAQPATGEAAEHKEREHNPRTGKPRPARQNSGEENQNAERDVERAVHDCPYLGIPIYSVNTEREPQEEAAEGDAGDAEDN